MLNVPILLIIFNRPQPTKKLIEALRIVKPDLVFVSADGPRENVIEDENNCEAARNIIDQIDWNCKIEKLYHSNNQGCHLAPRKALRWFFTNVEEGIILEDDCIPNKDFFFFCEELIATYRYDERIISISGCNLGYNLKNGNSYTFSRFMNMWGWATWRRVEQKIDYTLYTWRQEKNQLRLLHKKIRDTIFDIDIRWLEYWKRKFDECLRNDISTWDWQWMFYQITNDKYAIVPGVNMVTNIGFNALATHTKYTNVSVANIPVYSIKFPIKHPSKIKLDKAYERKYVKVIWCNHVKWPYLSQLKALINRLFIKPSKITIEH